MSDSGFTKTQGHIEGEHMFVTISNENRCSDIGISSGGVSGLAYGSRQQHLCHVEPNQYYQEHNQPLQVLSFSPSQGPPGTVLDIRVQLLDHAIQSCQFMVAIGAHSEWATAVLEQYGEAMEVSISVTCPEFLQRSTQYPLSLRTCSMGAGVLEDVHFGTFLCVDNDLHRWGSGIDRVNWSGFAEHMDVRLAVSPEAEHNNDVMFPQSALWKNSQAAPGSELCSPVQTQHILPLGDHICSSLEPQASSKQEVAYVSVASSRRSVENKLPPHRYRRHKPLAPRDPSHVAHTLVRTSQLASTASDLCGAAKCFNPHTLYPNKAVLKIDGDLEAMTRKWSNDEISGGRRLVEFNRKQSGRTITISFEPVAQAHRALHSFCVSCIYWKEKGEAYVTSVDTIHLLQCIIGIRFTVEEKNRIRRNLEGFHPLTVSKGKASCGDFFGLVMGFPYPKPRNIEKDVKVFPWKKLGLALKKIIGKYSASPSSTAGLLQPSAVPEDMAASSISPTMLNETEDSSALPDQAGASLLASEFEVSDANAPLLNRRGSSIAYMLAPWDTQATAACSVHLGILNTNASSSEDVDAGSGYIGEDVEHEHEHMSDLFE